MYKLIGAILSVTLVLTSADAALARKSSGSHSSSHKSSKSGFEKKCKTRACFKKHPSGDYYVPSKK